VADKGSLTDFFPTLQEYKQQIQGHTGVLPARQLRAASDEILFGLHDYQQIQICE